MFLNIFINYGKITLDVEKDKLENESFSFFSIIYQLPNLKKKEYFYVTYLSIMCSNLKSQFTQNQYPIYPIIRSSFLMRCVNFKITWFESYYLKNFFNDYTNFKVTFIIYSVSFDSSQKLTLMNLVFIFLYL